MTRQKETHHALEQLVQYTKTNSNNDLINFDDDLMLKNDSRESVFDPQTVDTWTTTVGKFKQG